MEKILTKEDLTNAIENHKDELLLLDWHASWCGPCRALGQIFNELLPIEGVAFADIDMDEADEELAVENNIRSIPTVLFYKNGLQIDRFTGMIGRDALENKIEENLEK